MSPLFCSVFHEGLHVLLTDSFPNLDRQKAHRADEGVVAIAQHMIYASFPLGLAERAMQLPQYKAELLLASELSTRWSGAWDAFNGMVTSTDLISEYPGQALSSTDFANQSALVGIKPNCPQIARGLNSKLADTPCACYEFVCRPDHRRYRIAPSIAIHEYFSE